MIRYTALKLLAILFLVVLYLIIHSSHTLAGRAIPENNLALPILVSSQGGPIGSAFFFDNGKNIYLVTAKHVLFKKDIQKEKDKWVLREKTLTLTQYRPDINENVMNKFKIDMENLFSKEMVRRHQSHDIAVVLFAEKKEKRLKFIDGVYPIKTEKMYPETMNCHISGIKKFEEVLIGNDIILFGYPTSIGLKEISQLDIERPLLRKGIIAGKNREKGTIIIDCPIYPGNSGSPVLEIERVKTQEKVDEKSVKFSFGHHYLVIGIAIQFVPFKEMWLNVRTKHMHSQLRNSGYSIVVPMDKVLELIPD